jgi:hypothetical protein
MRAQYHLLCLAALVISGCHVALGLDEIERVPADDAGVAAGGNGSTGAGLPADGTGGGVSGGGVSGACDASICPGIDRDCRARACADNDTCGFEDMAPGVLCVDTTNPSAQLCDGAGSCVACLSNADCVAGACQKQICVPDSCLDSELGAGESDVDCGGLCAPCNNGLVCNAGVDCASHFCNTGICAPCANDNACAAGEYCDSDSVCTPQAVTGDVCSANTACQSGHCAAGVCCNSSCGGACEACATIATGAANGTCAPVVVGAVCRGAAGGCDVAEVCDGVSVDCPNDERADAGTLCRPSFGVCDLAETCNGSSAACPADLLAPPTTVCRPAADVCDVADTCDGNQWFCPPNQVKPAGTASEAELCWPFLCGGLTAWCPILCTDDADCDAGVSCIAAACVP